MECRPLISSFHIIIRDTYCDKCILNGWKGRKLKKTKLKPQDLAHVNLGYIYCKLTRNGKRTNDASAECARCNRVLHSKRDGYRERVLIFSCGTHTLTHKTQQKY